MVKTHNLGFPRIGARRELKFALESYWKGQSSRDELKAHGAQLRQQERDIRPLAPCLLRLGLLGLGLLGLGLVGLCLCRCHGTIIHI